MHRQSPSMAANAPASRIPVTLAARSKARLSAIADAAAAPSGSPSASRVRNTARPAAAPHDDLEAGPGDQARPPASRALDAARPAIAAVRSKMLTAGKRERTTRVAGCGVRTVSGKPFRSDRGEGLRRERTPRRGVIGVEPRPLDPRHVRQPRHRLGVLVATRRSPGSRGRTRRAAARSAALPARGTRAIARRNRRPVMRSGSRIHGSQRVDQAHGDVVAIDVVSLRRRLAARPATLPARGVRVEQASAKPPRSRRLSAHGPAGLRMRSRMPEQRRPPP